MTAAELAELVALVAKRPGDLFADRRLCGGGEADEQIVINGNRFLVAALRTESVEFQYDEVSDSYAWDAAAPTRPAVTAAGRGRSVAAFADVNRNLKGESKINKSNAEGLVNGLDNAISQVAADQADKVRPWAYS